MEYYSAIKKGSGRNVCYHVDELWKHTKWEAPGPRAVWPQGRAILCACLGPTWENGTWHLVHFSKLLGNWAEYKRWGSGLQRQRPQETWAQKIHPKLQDRMSIDQPWQQDWVYLGGLPEWRAGCETVPEPVAKPCPGIRKPMCPRLLPRWNRWCHTHVWITCHKFTLRWH